MITAIVLIGLGAWMQTVVLGRGASYTADILADPQQADTAKKTGGKAAKTTTVEGE